jgi:hypothetical protein
METKSESENGIDSSKKVLKQDIDSDDFKTMLANIKGDLEQTRNVMSNDDDVEPTRTPKNRPKR